MGWLIFALIGVIGIAISNILERALLKDEKSNAFVYSFIFQILCGLLIGIFAIARGFLMPEINELWINYLIIMPFFYGAGTLFLFKAFQTAGASEVTIAFWTRSFWSIIVALIFLGESFPPIKILGVIFLFTGVILVSVSKNGLKPGKGVIFALIAAFFYGAAFINDAFILRRAEILSYTSLAFLLPAIPILLSRPKIVLEIKSFARLSIVLKMALLGIFYSASVTATYFAYQSGGAASQIAAIGQLTVILTVLLAALFLGEKNGLVKKLFAAILAAIGVILLS